jgi:hypothetical protein
MSITSSHKKKDTEMLKEFIDGFIDNLTYAIGIKSFKVKILYSAMFTIMFSPVAYIFDFIRDFLIPERYFFQTVIFLCLADAVMGVAKSYKLKRFNPLLLVIGLATKLGVSYVVVQIFQALSSPQEFINSPDARNYFVLTWKLMVMFYPALSAFNNIWYVSGKKFPPLWWMMRMQNFNKDGNVEKFLGKTQDEKQMD